MEQSEFTTRYLVEVRRRILEENIPRMQQCLRTLSQEDIWYRPNENSNSIGNLVLHLDGNLRQWVIATFNHLPDTRQRQQEFDQRTPLPVTQLETITAKLAEDLAATLARIIPDDLSKTYTVQGFQENGVGILLHAVEHFSYHVGQMTYFVKARKDMDMGYYEGVKLE
jgi:uncharacterized damage-inducible protein DinB